MPVSCQVCGAQNDDNAARCRACAAALYPPDADERAFPPLPDGGLTTAMPEWLRSSETTVPRDRAAAASPPDPARGTAFDPNDLRTILSEDDLPEWLRRIADRHAAVAPSSPELSTRAPITDVEPEFAARIAASGRERPASVEAGPEIPGGPPIRVRVSTDAPTVEPVSQPLPPSIERSRLAGDRRRAGIAIVGILLAALLAVVLLLI